MLVAAGLQRAPQASPEIDPGTSSDQLPVLVGMVTRVKDGDTIVVELDSGPINVRLGSIDAPEKDQPWGIEATTALRSRVQAREVALAVVEQDRYERLVAVVYLDDENLNAWMTREGNAWAYRAYLKDAEYCGLEDEARTSRLGLWAMTPTEWRAPWEWRQHQKGDRASFTDFGAETRADCIAASGRGETTPTRSLPMDPGAPATGCLIKGNISKNGRIYHVPGSEWYDETRIDESKGERWFCNVDEARAAGWRAPR
jgi:endonuclease YncB( thermonuclease family)